MHFLSSCSTAHPPPSSCRSDIASVRGILASYAIVSNRIASHHIIPQTSHQPPSLSILPLPFLHSIHLHASFHASPIPIPIPCHNLPPKFLPQGTRERENRKRSSSSSSSSSSNSSNQTMKRDKPPLIIPPLKISNCASLISFPHRYALSRGLGCSRRMLGNFLCGFRFS